MPPSSPPKPLPIPQPPLHIALPPLVQAVITALESSGFQAFAIGGCVRDSLLGQSPKDWDIATDATPEQIMALFSPTYRLITLGARFGTIGVVDSGALKAKAESRAESRADSRALLDSGGESRGDSARAHQGVGQVEITTFRLESGYVDSRHPEHVRYTDSLLEDIARRDFTCNALAYNPRLAHFAPESTSLESLESSALDSALAPALDSRLGQAYARYAPYVHGGVCDSVGGLVDLREKILRCVGDAHRRFSEDGLRILRGVRFCASLGFRLERETECALLACAQKLAAISAERKSDEWGKILRAGHIADVLVPCNAGKKRTKSQACPTSTAQEAPKIAAWLGVWAQVFCEFASELESIAQSSSAQERLHAHLRALERYNAHTTQDEQHNSTAQILRLCVWLYGLLDSAAIDTSTRESIFSHNLSARIERCLLDLRYSRHIATTCAKLIPRALILTTCGAHKQPTLRDTLALAHELDKNAESNSTESRSITSKNAESKPLESRSLQNLTLLAQLLVLIDQKPTAQALEAHIATIREQALCYQISHLAINGDDIRALAPSIAGRQIGEILRTLLEMVMDSALENTPQALRAAALKQSTTAQH